MILFIKWSIWPAEISIHILYRNASDQPNQLSCKKLHLHWLKRYITPSIMSMASVSFIKSRDRFVESCQSWSMTYSRWLWIRWGMGIYGQAYNNKFLVTNTRWRHQMKTLSTLLAICAGNSPVPINSPYKGQWHGALMSTLICTRINGWVIVRLVIWDAIAPIMTSS